MSRFEKGDTVWYGRGEHERKLVVARVIDNGMIPVYQYSFEAPNNGWACGEQSLRAEQHDADLTLRECFKENSDKVVSTRINTIASGLRNPIDFNAVLEGSEALFQDCNLRFKPDLIFAKWITDYADGRLCIDVGSGQGHLVNMLKMKQAKVIGIEPNFDSEQWLKWRMQRMSLENIDINEVLARPVEDCKNIIAGIGTKGMLIFARPKSRDFVDTAIRNMPSGMEALFITTEEDFNSFNYLGEFRDIATPIEHKGKSEGNEVVYSIIRP